MPDHRDYFIDLNEMELPVIVQVDSNLYAAVFALMKLIVARYLIRRGERLGDLGLGGHVLESTSGTMGLGLAYACRESGYRLTVVSDPIMDESLRLKLLALDANLVIVDKSLPKGGFQAARLDALKVLKRQIPGSYWTRQYDNKAAPKAYYPAAQKITESVGRVDLLVAAVATGSSATGLIRGLLKTGQSAHLIAIDTHHSVLFGQTDSKRLLRGLGNSIVPKNLDYSLVKQCHWVSAAEAFKMTHLLFNDHLLDVGPTSGATYLVARWLAAKNPDKNVVFVCADTGERYRSTVYNPEWLTLNKAIINKVPKQPRLVQRPNDAREHWTYMNWKGRSVQNV